MDPYWLSSKVPTLLRGQIASGLGYVDMDLRRVKYQEDGVGLHKFKSVYHSLKVPGFVSSTISTACV
jgi:hypothetical protein